MTIYEYFSSKKITTCLHLYCSTWMILNHCMIIKLNTAVHRQHNTHADWTCWIKVISCHFPMCKWYVNWDTHATYLCWRQSMLLGLFQSCVLQDLAWLRFIVSTLPWPRKWIPVKKMKQQCYVYNKQPSSDIFKRFRCHLMLCPMPCLALGPWNYTS